MPKVLIDETEYEVREGRNMLEAALDNDLDLPYFCWHPAMGSVGACRLCAVRAFKDEQDAKGKIMMACMISAKEGTRISTKDPEAVEFRRYVIEWLMTNHPHDCPVCDEGGECHLQDMTTMCGHIYRRFKFNKRTFTNQDLGPFVTHEMNRCIQCYRCVRFYRDVAGGTDFHFFGSRNRIYFGRGNDGVLESEFSGNLVEVCPTGVFDDKTSARHYTRKWDLETAPSVCIHCGLGCNTIPGARYGTIRRVTARFNGDVNGYFLCDRGRYGYEYANDKMAAVEPDMAGIRSTIAEAKGIIGIGSPRASLESNYALRKLVGDEHFSTGLSAYEQHGIGLAIEVLRGGSARTLSLAEVELCDVILVLGIDPTNESPMLDFAIRQAMRKAPLDIARKLKIPDWDAKAVATALQDAKGELHIAAPWSLKLGKIAASSVQLSLHSIADYAYEIHASISDPSNPVAAALANARQSLIVTGISAGGEILGAAARIAGMLCEKDKNCGLFITVPEANTMGVGMLGGFSVEEALRRVESGVSDTVIVLENDLSRRLSSNSFSHLTKRAKSVIVLDCITTDTTAKADAVVPIPSYFETNGTFVNNEGRAQRFYAVKSNGKPAWTVLQELMESGNWATEEDVLRDLAEHRPEFAPALDAAPFPDWRSTADQKVARKPHRFSGRTAKEANRTIHEPQTPPDPNTPFTFSMEGDQNPPPAPLIPRFWWPGWNSNEAINKFQIEVGGGLHGGNPGRRLIEPPNQSGPTVASTTIPTAETDQVWVIPRPFIYGSEELSQRARGVASLVPKAEAYMHPELANRLHLCDGHTAQIDMEDQSIYLPIRIDETVAVDVVLVPMGFAETRGVISHALARIK